MIIDRILHIIEYKNISKRSFYTKTKLSNGFLDKVKDIGVSKIENILSAYPDVNPIWLLTGNGEMLLKDSYKEITEGSSMVNESSINFNNKGVPFWDLPVSAGLSLTEIKGKKKADGYVVGLPGADIAENLFPVTGMSMEPEISPGAIIGVRKIDNWETLNTERVYLIITREDRMIKRVEHDHENIDILWCISPNYPKFKIYKSEIIEIQRVCFVYNPK